MPWLKVGDTASTHPTVIAVDDHPAADVAHSLACELFGFVTLCATMAAGHLTDYVVSFPAAQRVAGSRQRAAELLDLAEWAGYGVNRTDDDGRRVFILTEDADLLHMFTAAEVAAERQRRTDTSNPAIIVPVRRRDGDACRYCGTPVVLSDRKGARGLTYDHRAPLTQPATVETMVVACKACNSARGAIAQQHSDHAAGLAAADAAHPLRPVPATPHYSRSSLAMFDRHAAILERPEPSPDSPEQTPPRRSADNLQIPPDNLQISADSARQDLDHAGTGIWIPGMNDLDHAGTGRVGTGRAGSGREGPGGARKGGQRPQPRRKGRGRR